jgi:hypothetical protein
MAHSIIIVRSILPHSLWNTLTATLSKMTTMPKHPLTRKGSNNKKPDGYWNRTYDDIAEELGMTREGVRQVEIRALAKLRKGLEEMGLTFEDLVKEMDRGAEVRLPEILTK